MSLPLRNSQSIRGVEIRPSEKLKVNLSRARGTLTWVAVPCASENDAGGAQAGREAQKQEGEGGKDFLKGCWRRGVASRARRSRGVQASRSSPLWAREGLAQENLWRERGPMGQMEQG